MILQSDDEEGGGAYMWSGEVEISGVILGIDLDVVVSGLVCD